METLDTNFGQDCTGSKLLEACRPVGAESFTLLAMANRDDVLFDVGSENVTHKANGVGWYFSHGWSMGFADAGDSVERNSCDVLDVDAESRLCWHTSDWIDVGWRCGTTTDLNEGYDWERVIFQAD